MPKASAFDGRLCLICIYLREVLPACLFNIHNAKTTNKVPAVSVPPSGMWKKQPGKQSGENRIEQMKGSRMSRTEPTHQLEPHQHRHNGYGNHLIPQRPSKHAVAHCRRPARRCGKGQADKTAYTPAKPSEIAAHCRPCHCRVITEDANAVTNGMVETSNTTSSGKTVFKPV